MITALLLAALASPTALPPVVAPGPAPSEGIDWYEDGYNRALREAKKRDTLVFIAFVPEASEYSQRVVAETFPDERVAAELADLVCLSYGDERNSRFQSVRKLFNVETYPTFVLATHEGQIEDRIEGYIPPEPMLEQLQRIKAGEGTVTWHRAQVEAEPEELEHLYSLAQMLEAVRDYDEAERSYAAIRRADPKGETTAGARLALQEIWAAVRESSGDDASQWDLEPVHHFLANVASEAAVFQGWTEIGNFHAGREGGLGDSADAFMQAWEHCPEGGSRGWARDVASFLASNGGESLELRHQVFAIDLATRAVEEAQRARDEYVAEHGTTTSEDGGDYDAWVAGHLAVLAECQHAFGQVDDAVASARRCTELDPENPEYTERLASLIAQR